MQEVDGDITGKSLVLERKDSSHSCWDPVLPGPFQCRERIIVIKVKISSGDL